jgi:hypothetical protein
VRKVVFEKNLVNLVILIVEFVIVVGCKKVKKRTKIERKREKREI